MTEQDAIDLVAKALLEAQAEIWPEPAESLEGYQQRYWRTLATAAIDAVAQAQGSE